MHKSITKDMMSRSKRRAIARILANIGAPGGVGMANLINAFKLVFMLRRYPSAQQAFESAEFQELLSQQGLTQSQIREILIRSKLTMARSPRPQIQRSLGDIVQGMAWIWLAGLILAGLIMHYPLIMELFPLGRGLGLNFVWITILCSLALLALIIAGLDKLFPGKFW